MGLLSFMSESNIILNMGRFITWLMILESGSPREGVPLQSLEPLFVALWLSSEYQIPQGAEV